MLYRFLNRLIAGDRVAAGGAASPRNVIVWLFIAVVATFLTHPLDGPTGASGVSGAYDRPVPWPAELGLDDRFGI